MSVASIKWLITRYIRVSVVKIAIWLFDKDLLTFLPRFLRNSEADASEFLKDLGRNIYNI